jgi:N-acetylneuraminic acid mutarotase
LKLKLLGFCLLVSSQLFSQNWQKIQDFSGTERDDAVSFTINNQAYCGTGLSPWFAEFADFYSFDFNTQSWTSIASLPIGKERQYATAFSNDTLGFVFSGNKGNVFLNDLWMYNPTNNSWTQKTSLPAVGRNGSYSFVINNIAYIVGGKTANNTFLSEVWTYDIHNNLWEQKNDFPFGNFWRSSSKSIGDFGYLIFGADSFGNYSNRVYKYFAENDSWEFINEFPLTGRTYCSMEKLYNQLYVIGGVDSSFNYQNDFWTLDLENNLWTQLQSINTLPFKGGISFSVGNEIYYSTGINNQNSRLKETWKIANPTPSKELTSEEDIFIYPNPTESILKIEGSKKILAINVLNSQQKMIINKQYLQNNIQLNISELSTGIYFLEIISEKKISRRKIVKN